MSAHAIRGLAIIVCEIDLFFSTQRIRVLNFIAGALHHCRTATISSLFCIYRGIAIVVCACVCVRVLALCVWALRSACTISTLPILIFIYVGLALHSICTSLTLRQL